MALSRQVIISDGTTTEYPITFADGYLSRDEVSVYEEFDDSTPNANIDFIFINDYLIELSRVPAEGNKIVIERDVEANARKVNFIPQYIKSTDLNTMYKHLLYLIQSVLDGRFEQAIIKDLNMGYNRIYNLGAPQQPNDAVRLADIKTYTDLAESLNNQNTAHAEAAKQSEINAKASADASAASAQSAANTVNGFDTHAAEKQTEFNNNAADKTSSFNANVVSKTNDFDANAASKTQEYNANAAQKQAQVDAGANAAANSATSASTSATNAAKSENNAEIWAEGTDEQVQALGGIHSSKVWAAESSKEQVQTDWNQTDDTQKDYIKNKPTKLSQFTNDIDTLPDQTGNADKFLKTDGTTASWAEIGGGLEVGDIGFAPLGIDESKNKRRYLNGQVISQTQFVTFTDKVKKAVALYPSLSATEENWQAEVTNSKLGQCGKFVIDDTAGIIRLPKVVNINGLTDLSTLGGIRVESLPNITGVVAGIRRTDNMQSPANSALYWKVQNYKNKTVETGGTASADIAIDLSRNNSTYQDNAPVQQEAVQYPYFIQVATGSEESVDVSTEIQLNNPFSLFESKYSTDTVINASWLISNGSYHSGTTYVTAYQALIVENNTSIAKETTVTLPNGTSYTKHGLSVKLSTGAYNDYDYVLNTADSTFRLPVSSHDNGRVLIESYVNGNDWYNIYSDGWCEQGGFIPVQTRNDNFPVTLFKSYKDTNYSLITDKHIATSISNTMATHSFYTKNKTVSGFTTGIDTNVECTWRTAGYIDVESTGINLYFYVGETIQDANVINAAGVLTRVANGIDRTVASDRSIVSGWAMPSNRYIDLTLGASGISYTAPANGWFVLHKAANSVGQYVYMHTIGVDIGTCFNVSSGTDIPSYFLPVKAGDIVGIDYNLGGATKQFRFIYAEGEE